MADLTLKTFDTYPPLVATLSDSHGPLDLTGASVIVVMKGTLGNLITGACVISSPLEGVVTYNWQTGDTNTADTYSVEWMITWGGNGGIQKVPNIAANNPTVEIDAALAGSAG